jgi:predicted HD phosphohydrolase
MDKLNQAIQLYLATGDETFGENITHLEHAIQSYIYAKQHYPNDITLSVAAFWHDIGHSMYILQPSLKCMRSPDGTLLGIHDHDHLAAEMFKGVLNDRCCTLIKYHTMAKRYNAHNLSPASQETLLLEGGMLTDSERQIFENHPLFHDILQLRICDDAAKNPLFDYALHGGKDMIILDAISNTIRVM